MLKFIVLLLLATWAFSGKEAPKTEVANVPTVCAAETTGKAIGRHSCEPSTGKQIGNQTGDSAATPAQKSSAPVYTVVRKSNHNDRHRH